MLLKIVSASLQLLFGPYSVYLVLGMETLRRHLCKKVFINKVYYNNKYSVELSQGPEKTVINIRGS